MRLTRNCGIVVTAALLSLSCQAGTSWAQATSGINGAAAEPLPASQLAQQLSAMQGQGVQVVRADVPWARVEPTPPSSTGVHTYHWDAIDWFVIALAQHHLRLQPLIDFSVWWAKSCPGFCAPDDPNTFATYAQAVAARYGAGGSFWAQHPQLPYLPAQIFEIWNEENVARYYIDPATYGRLYLASRTAIHTVDPAASVDVGGLADDSGTFNPSLDYPSWYVINMFGYDPALRGNVDGFGLHPYGATASDVQRWVAEFRYVLATRNEGSVPIDITELGWRYGPLSESWRATQMSAVATALGNSNCGIRLIEPYDWINPTTSDFGLVDSSGAMALRPSGAAWFAGLVAANSRPTTTCS